MQAGCSFEISGGEVHIWTLRTRASDAVAAMFERVLVTEEIERAIRSHFGHLRESFVIARGALRFLLGCYLDIRPNSIRFIYGLKGKPALESVAGIEFNMTHSGSLAAVAITAEFEIGVDLEQKRPPVGHAADCRPVFLPGGSCGNYVAPAK